MMDAYQEERLALSEVGMVEFTCDGCGKKAAVLATRDGLWFKPCHWYERTDEDGTQTACSRECIKLIAEKTGKTDVVLPI